MTRIAGSVGATSMGLRHPLDWAEVSNPWGLPPEPAGSLTKHNAPRRLGQCPLQPQLLPAAMTTATPGMQKNRTAALALGEGQQWIGQILAGNGREIGKQV
jgi:hypothetical protein